MYHCCLPPPPGILVCFACSACCCCCVCVLQDDPLSPEYNVQARVELFVAEVESWSKLLRGNDVLLMVGSDFEYANAHAVFANLDK